MGRLPDYHNDAHTALMGGATDPPVEPGVIDIQPTSGLLKDYYPAQLTLSPVILYFY